MHALRAQTEIISGAYTHANISRRGEDGQDIQLTDREKLRNKIEEMKRHIYFMQTLLDNKDRKQGES